jgi:orotidine-5'-phosphate decarboxylase
MSKLEQSTLDKLIVALDFPSKEETFKFLKRCNDQSFRPAMLKIGMELFYSEGPEMLREIQDMGFKIFLDLKIHDIPNTTASALKAIAKLNVDITNIHAFAGKAAMKAAAEAIKEVSPKTKLIAVTILTSMSQDMLRDDLLINTTLEDYVLKLALNSNDFLTVCPGIRFADTNSDDQQRIMTPEKAIASGADYIVMGRAITKAL